MANYLDDKIDQIIDLSMQMKRYFQHEGNISSGITMLQLETLKYIKNHSEISMKELADYLSISMSSATQLVERMVENELVLRLLDKNDRRIIRLKLSTKGEKELFDRTSIVQEKIRILYSKLSEKDLKQYIKIQKKLLSLLNN